MYGCMINNNVFDNDRIYTCIDIAATIMCRT